MHNPSEPPTPPALLRPQEAADYLAISERNLWDLTDEGKIPVVWIGKRGKRYRRVDLDAFIASLANEPGTEAAA